MSGNYYWTRYAIDSKFVRIEENGDTYFDQVPEGNYLATGKTVDGEKFRRKYKINYDSSIDSKWNMWRDFCGRHGLKNLWIIRPDGSRKLLVRK